MVDSYCQLFLPNAHDTHVHMNTGIYAALYFACYNVRRSFS